MASCSCRPNPSLLLLLLLLLALVSVAAAATDMVHLRFYMHENVTGPNPTSVRVARGPVQLPGSPYNFGDIAMVDDLLTEGPSPASRPVGRAQGTFVVAKSGPAVEFVLNIVIADGPYNGSTVSCLGRDLVVAPVRELPVVGGTGKFRMARGYVLVRTHSVNTTTGDAVLELDVYAERYKRW